MQEQEKVTQEANKSRAGAGREEGERLFGSLLVDQIRSHDVSLNSNSFIIACQY
jgi:transcription elongation regulator 1